MEQQAYIPGVCNINKAEIAYRRKAMIAGFVIAALLFVGLLFTQLDGWLRALIVLVPLYVGIIGYFQVRNHFCVSYGAIGKQNATDGHATALEVDEAEARVADKKKARTMNLQAFAITLVALALSAFI